MPVHILGIRHHGPGSARSVREALDALRPGCVLIEGPPEGQPVLSLAVHADMKPPVAMLAYRPDAPRVAAFYPFAVFSPEWQALDWAAQAAVPVRLMDMPLVHRFAMKDMADMAAAKRSGDDDAHDRDVDDAEDGDHEPDDEGDVDARDDDARDADAQATALDVRTLRLRADPMGWLARAAGMDDEDGEQWWDRFVESRSDATEIFPAILEAMRALRTEFPEDNDTDLKREAFMRQAIRAARKEFESVAVVCGAWHAPALASDTDNSEVAATPKPSEDAALVKGMPKVKIAMTWVPWTNARLAFASGYGAGVRSPGWYEHLWHAPRDADLRWMTRIARLLREADLDASPAQVIDAVRLATSLAALRDRSRPSLRELNESALATMCFGNTKPLELIHARLIVGDKLGGVPAETPMVPLAQDLAAEQKRLRLKPTAEIKDHDFDLRKEIDLGRSRLLHRLRLLGVEWGEIVQAGAKLGTFHEYWQTRWRPELSVELIAASRWGNTIETASQARVAEVAGAAKTLPDLTALLKRTLLADLPDAVARLMVRIEQEAAVASDIAHLMTALPALADVTRYGDVRKTDTTLLAHVIDGLVVRVCIGLPGACASLNDDAAEATLENIINTHGALAILQNADHSAAWTDTLRRLTDQSKLHGLIAGRAVRLLLDGEHIDRDDGTWRLNLALSRAAEPAHAAAWLDGLLRGSGMLLLHDDVVWPAIDGWISGLADDHFMDVLPLLRRVFATFQPGERRRLAERVRKDPSRSGARAAAAAVRGNREDFDQARADAVLPTLALLLGVTPKPRP